MRYRTRARARLAGTAGRTSLARHPAARGPARRGGWLAIAAVTAMLVLAAAGCGAGSPPHASQGGAAAGESGIGLKGGGRGEHHGKAGPAVGAGSGNRSGVLGGALFGGDVPLAAVQPELGRKLAIVRSYYRLGQTFPTPVDRALMAQGSTLLVSLDTFPGGPTYAAIASGRYDPTISAFLKAMEQAAVTYRLPAIYFCFEHEANVPAHHQGLGTPAQFIAAWDHIHHLAAAMHLDWNQGGRLHWVFILTHFGYANGAASRFWPGSDEVDIVGADGYNTGGCRLARASGGYFTTGRTPPVTPAELFDPVLRFARAHGNLPVFIAEWGSVAYSSPQVRVNFIHQMASYVAANREIAAALYWDSSVAPCNYVVNNSPSSLAALAAMAHAPTLEGRLATR
jgi:hypothetical protein